MKEHDIVGCLVGWIVLGREREEEVVNLGKRGEWKKKLIRHGQLW